MFSSDAFPLAGKGVVVDPEYGRYTLFINDQNILDRLAPIPCLNLAGIENDTHIIQAPIHEDTLKLFKNAGLNVAGMEPFNWQYSMPLVEGVWEPMEHQKATAAFLSANPRAMCTSTMRTGKTYSSVIAADYLLTVDPYMGAWLIIATVSNMTGVWKYTIDTTLPHRVAHVVHSRDGKAGRLKVLKDPGNFYIINYDGVKMCVDALSDMIAAGRIGGVIIDEATHYGNPSSDRFKALDRIINIKNNVKYVWGLTGTPGDKPEPYFGYLKMILPHALPCKTKAGWLNMTMDRYGPETYMVKPKPGIMPTITKLMQPTIRYDKKDIMDLPPIVQQTRTCELSGEQNKAYTAIKNEMIFLNETGEVVEAVNKAAHVSKLLQTALGSVITTDGEAITLDHKSRTNTIVEVINEAENKVVIFCPFTRAIDNLVKDLRDKGFDTEYVDGRVTGQRRDSIFHDFQNTDRIKVLVCHPQTTAFGVELAAASTMIFNGPPQSGGFIYEQALERLSSLKQSAKQIMIVRIVATKEEEKYFKNLDSGVEQNVIVNEIFASMNK